MSVRFDDALPLLIQSLRSSGINPDDPNVIILRDATGRLGVAIHPRPAKGELARRIREALGAYALAEPVLPQALFGPLKESQPRHLPVRVENRDYQWIHFLDRRIVGVDWLSGQLEPSDGPPRLIFGSLKGGVGRTTALTVLAAALAQNGKHVLCIDLDLEAPGLSSMLLRSDAMDDRRPKYGALDYLVEDGIGPLESEDLLDFIGTSHLGSGGIHVLPAVGAQTDRFPENMLAKLARGLIEDVTDKGRRSVAEQIRQMVDRFVQQGNYDAVLVDARAGLAEVTAAAWLGLGAQKLLLFGVDQPQTFQGYRYALAQLRATLGIPESDALEDWRTRLRFVHCKAPASQERRLPYREKIFELCSEMLYEEEEDGPDGPPVFTFAFDETGIDIPHDVSYISYHPDYDAFSPLDDATTLDPEVYRGPYGAFLQHCWTLLELGKRT